MRKAQISSELQMPKMNNLKPKSRDILLNTVRDLPKCQGCESEGKTEELF